MKRSVDFIFSFLAIILFAPIVIIFAILIWLEDGKWPFYTPLRVGKSGKNFRLYKLRSMVANADVSKVDTSTNNDLRITKIGKKINMSSKSDISSFLIVGCLLGIMKLNLPSFYKMNCLKLGKIVQQTLSLGGALTFTELC